MASYILGIETETDPILLLELGHRSGKLGHSKELRGAKIRIAREHPHYTLLVKVLAANGFKRRTDTKAHRPDIDDAASKLGSDLKANLGDVIFVADERGGRFSNTARVVGEKPSLNWNKK